MYFVYSYVHSLSSWQGSPLSLSWSAGGCCVSGTSLFASRCIPDKSCKAGLRTSTYHWHTEYVLSTNWVCTEYILVCTEYILSTDSVQGYARCAVTLQSCNLVYFQVQTLCILSMAHGCIGAYYAIVPYQPPASTGGRQVGLERKPEAPGQVGPKQNLGQIWNTSLKFSKVEARVLFGWQTSITMTEDHVSSLFCCCLFCFITIKLNSISQSDQSSWKTFCESLYRKSFR